MADLTLVCQGRQGTANARDPWSLANSLHRLPELSQVLQSIDALTPWVPADDCADVKADIDLIVEEPLAITEGGHLSGESYGFG